MPASPWFANSSGLISAGVLALIGDAALGSVVHSDVEAGQGMTTAELSMSFLRPVVPKPGSAVTGSGQLIHRGRTMGISEAFLFDDDDELISHGTTRCSVFPRSTRSPIRPTPTRRRSIRRRRAARRTTRCVVRSRASRSPKRFSSGAPGLEVLRDADRRRAAEAADPPPDRARLDRGGGGGDGRRTALQQVAVDLGRHGAGRVHGDARRVHHDRRGLQHHAAPHRRRGSRLQGQLPAAGLPRWERPDREGTDPPSGADAGDRRRRDHSTPRASRSRWPPARRCTCRAGPPT